MLMRVEIGYVYVFVNAMNKVLANHNTFLSLKLYLGLCYFITCKDSMGNVADLI